MDKVIISSLTAKDFEQLHSLSFYLLNIKCNKDFSPFSGDTFFVSTEPVVFTVEDLALLKKLKHLHVLSYGKK